MSSERLGSSSTTRARMGEPSGWVSCGRLLVMECEVAMGQLSDLRVSRRYADPVGRCESQPSELDAPAGSPAALRRWFPSRPGRSKHAEVTGGPVAPHSPCTGTVRSLEWTESPRSKEYAMNSDNNRPVPQTPKARPKASNPLQMPDGERRRRPMPLNRSRLNRIQQNRCRRDPRPTDPLATHNLPAAGWGSTRPSGGWGAPASAGSFPAGSFSGKGPDGRSKPWTRKRGLVVAGAAAVLAGGAGVGVYALTSGAAAADTATDGQAMLGTAPGARGGRRAALPAGCPPRAGRATSPRADWEAWGAACRPRFTPNMLSFRTAPTSPKLSSREQSLRSARSSVTVKSTDGFSRTYSLGSDVSVSNVQQRRQQAGGTSTSQLTVADIVSGARSGSWQARTPTASRPSPSSSWRRP